MFLHWIFYVFEFMCNSGHDLDWLLSFFLFSFLHAYISILTILASKIYESRAISKWFKCLRPFYRTIHFVTKMSNLGTRQNLNFREDFSATIEHFDIWFWASIKRTNWSHTILLKILWRELVSVFDLRKISFASF